MSQPERRRGLVVLGMHRSGTSAMTRALNLLGAQLGDSSDLYVAHDNPDGHWESAALIRSNDEILAKFGGSWAAPPFLPSGWENSARASALIPRLRHTFATIYEGAEAPWLWKDPRTCLTLPLWRRVLCDITVVLVSRHPEAVARSLNRRDGFRRGYGLALWRTYTRSALAAAAGLPLTVVRFEEVQADPIKSIAGLAERLNELGVTLSRDLQTAAASLHPSSETPSTRSPTSRRQRKILEALNDVPVVTRSFSPPRLNPAPKWVHALDFGSASFPWGIQGRHPNRPRL